MCRKKNENIARGEVQKGRQRDGIFVINIFLRRAIKKVNIEK